jgi:hypothetical protein
VPVGLLLFLTGKIGKLELAEFSIEAAFVKAAESGVSAQVADLSALPVETIEVATKGGVGDIPRLIEKGSEALSFRLGYSGYNAGAIDDYVDRLTQAGALRYLVFTREDGSFFGLVDAKRLAGMLRGRRLHSNDLARWLAQSDEEPLAQLPGFISAANALSVQSDKRTALQAMENLATDQLPVVDEAGRLTGIVDRSRLSSSMLVDIAAQLGAKP